MSLIEKIEATGLIKRNDKIVIGVSGGPDSVCLFDVLAKLRDKLNLKLFVVHINHSIRKEADIEQEYVKDLCKKYNVQFFYKKLDVKKIAESEKKSLEEVARNIRYNEFYKVKDSVNANKIAVAHNANDNIETMLMNLTRGAGLVGLCGIPRENGDIVRPLLDVTRDEILKYVESNELKVFFDKTNYESDYTRNKIRNIIIPEFLKINPSFIETSTRCLNVLEGQKNILLEVIEEKYKEVRVDKGVLNKTKFLKMSYEIQLEVLRKAIDEYNGNLVDISFSNLCNAINIISSAQSGKIVEIFPDLMIEISYDLLKFCREKKDEQEFCYEINLNGETYIPELNRKITSKIVSVDEVPSKYEDKNKCFFDIEKTGRKVYVRNKREGDFIALSGMQGKKTLKKFFSDLKIGVDERNKVPIVATDAEVVWIVGYRTSKKFLKDKATKEVIILEYGENI